MVETSSEAGAETIAKGERRRELAGARSYEVRASIRFTSSIRVRSIVKSAGAVGRPANAKTSPGARSVAGMKNSEGSTQRLVMLPGMTSPLRRDRLLKVVHTKTRAVSEARGLRRSTVHVPLATAVRPDTHW